MGRIFRGALPVCAAALLLGGRASAGEKRLPMGEAGNETVHIEATYYDSAQLKETFGTDFDNLYSVVEVTLTPRGGKTLAVHLDDFLMRSEATGAHSGPLAASQIAGQSSLVVNRTEAEKKKGGFGGGIGLGGIMMGGGGNAAPPPEAKVEVRTSDNPDPMLGVLKRKILAEKPADEEVSGLLFFPLDKEKAKNLVLVYTTPAAAPNTSSDAPAAGGDAKLRIRFK
jgi:hypothetical protein